jgi:hypothetical protein
LDHTESAAGASRSPQKNHAAPVCAALIKSRGDTIRTCDLYVPNVDQLAGLNRGKSAFPSKETMLVRHVRNTRTIQLSPGSRSQKGRKKVGRLAAAFCGYRFAKSNSRAAHPREPQAKAPAVTVISFVAGLARRMHCKDLFWISIPDAVFFLQGIHPCAGLIAYSHPVLVSRS